MIAKILAAVGAVLLVVVIAVGGWFGYWALTKSATSHRADIGRSTFELEYRVVDKSGVDVGTHSVPLQDAAIAEAGRVWSDWAAPGFAPHQVESRPLRDAGWTRLPRGRA